MGVEDVRDDGEMKGRGKEWTATCVSNWVQVTEKWTLSGP